MYQYQKKNGTSSSTVLITLVEMGYERVEMGYVIVEMDYAMVEIGYTRVKMS